MVCRTQCQDPSNRIYSTLATVDREPVVPITPDSLQSSLDAARDILRRGSGMGLVWHSQGLCAVIDARELAEDDIDDLRSDVWRLVLMPEAPVCTGYRDGSKIFDFINAQMEGF